MNSFVYIILIISSVLLEVTAQFILKLKPGLSNLNNHGNKILIVFYDYLKRINVQEYKIIIGVFLYAVLGFVVSRVINYKQLIVYNIIWHLIHFLVLFLVGIYIFNEKLNTKKIVASALGLSAIGLFLTDHHH